MSATFLLFYDTLKAPFPSFPQNFELWENGENVCKMCATQLTAKGHEKGKAARFPQNEEMLYTALTKSNHAQSM